MDNDYEQEFMKLVGEFMEQGFSQQEAIEEARERLSKEMATGGRVGLADGTMMASAPDAMDERNQVMEAIAMKQFGKPLKDLSEDEVKSVVKGLGFLFPDYVKLGYERYSSDEERVRKVKKKNKVIEDKKRILGELTNKILNRLMDAGKYEDTSNMTKYAVLTLQKLSERPAELGVS